MNEISDAHTELQWVRAYTVLARSGLVTNEVLACETAWQSEYLGNVTAAERMMRTRGYRAYAHALRALLPFPFTVYRVLTRCQLDSWMAGGKLGVLAATASLDIARAFRQIYPGPEGERVLLALTLSNPETLIMRGRVHGCELVIDTDLIAPADVAVVTD